MMRWYQNAAIRLSHRTLQRYVTPLKSIALPNASTTTTMRVQQPLTTIILQILSVVDFVVTIKEPQNHGTLFKNSRINIYIHTVLEIKKQKRRHLKFRILKRKYN